MEKRKIRRIALIALFCAASATPCSFDITPALTFRVRPDMPVHEYVDGKLGVVLPAYARSHLFVAYRWFQGRPLTAAERKGVTALLEHRLKELEVSEAPADTPVAWEAARAAVRGVKPGPPPPTDRRDEYSWYLNCTYDAFATATATLRQRVQTFGAKSDAVKSWLDAQEIVFGNCDGERDRFPAPADDSLPAVIRADRAYQTGAALFYARKFPDARRQFLAVARDTTSPWHQTARLVATRVLIRDATLVQFNTDDPYAFYGDAMEAAERELRAILADRNASPIHDAAQDLLTYVEFRAHPARRLHDTAAALMAGKASARRIYNELADYTYLLDRDYTGTDDLTDWILTFQNAGSEESAQHARDRWRATKQTHWLVAAISRATGENADALLEATSAFPVDSPAYPTIAHHRARLLIALRKHAAARAELDRVLALDLPHSGRNLLAGQRRDLARTLEDFVRDVPAVAVGIDVDQSTYEMGETWVPPEAAAVMNDHMPLELLARAAATESLDPGARAPILAAAWTRALLLGRNDLVADLTPQFLEHFPDLEPNVRAWENAPQHERGFAAARLFLRTGALSPYVAPVDPRLGHGAYYIDVFHGGRNWWCAGKLRFTWEEPAKPAVPLFLREKELAETAARERKKLTALGSAPTWMLRNILDYAKAHPRDARIAETLSLAIRETRWSCGDGQTSKLARRAFTLLHDRYEGTRWAKETPYWYGPTYGGS